MRLSLALPTLFWTFAEGLILVYVRSGYLLVTRGRANQPVLPKVALIVFLLLIVLIFAGDQLASRWIDLGVARNRTLYRMVSWHFFCTLWVTLEGAIMIYVYRIYRALHSSPRANPVAAQPKQSVQSWPMFGIPLLVVSLFLLYILYESLFLEVVQNYRPSNESIRGIFGFYIRICGVFWITFEWAVAIIGIKAYRNLKEVTTP